MSEMPCPADPHDTSMLMLLIPRFCGSGPASTCYVTARAAVGRGLSQLTVSCEGPGTRLTDILTQAVTGSASVMGGQLVTSQSAVPGLLQSTAGGTAVRSEL